MTGIASELPLDMEGHHPVADRGDFSIALGEYLGYSFLSILNFRIRLWADSTEQPQFHS
jgi:hypothetical protein